jgi:hypothetical protein
VLKGGRGQPIKIDCLVRRLGEAQKLLQAVKMNNTLTECPVCYEGYETSKYCDLPCLHPICDGCYKKLTTKSCPCCRADIGDRKLKPVKRTKVAIDVEEIKQYKLIEDYYNSKIEWLVKEALNHYNNSKTDVKKTSITIELTNYYYTTDDKGKQHHLQSFKDLVERINTYLCRAKLITKIKCAYNTGVRDKSDKSEFKSKYFITYDFAFY